MERHVDSFEGDGRKAAFKGNGLGLAFRLLDTLTDHLHKMGLDVLQRHTLHERGDVDVLSLQVVEEVGKAVNCAQLVGS